MRGSDPAPPWIDEVYAALPELAPRAEVRVYPGSGHASKMLEGRPELAAEIATWLAAVLDLPGSGGKAYH